MTRTGRNLTEKCGVFGVFGHPSASYFTALGIRALQHRGEEACGITSYDEANHKFHTERHMGWASHAFGDFDFRNMPGIAAIGHNRYATQGVSEFRNIQPLYADLKDGGMALAHNGNLTNWQTLRRALVADGAIFQSTSDTEVVMHLTAQSRSSSTDQQFIEALKSIEGGFALVCLTHNELIGARDPNGIRPLVLGRMEQENAWVLSSETCAFHTIGAKFVREIEPGEVIIINDGMSEPRSITNVFPPMTERRCAFEYVYFARPDSVVGGQSIYDVRQNMGRELARETGVDADIVVAVPDSGLPAAMGYAKQSGIPLEMGIIRSHYAGRSFIQPADDLRQDAILKKHAPNPAVLRGKRVVLVDDSIVRGSTSKQVVAMVRAAGAKEIHFRSASPEVRYPDHYGIDLAKESELLAHNKTHLEMQTHMDVDSLGFISVDGFYRAVGFEDGRDPVNPQLADHVFTKHYPTPLTDRDGLADHVLPYQPSLLAAQVNG